MSSTISTAPTLPIDDNWARPVDPCILERCCEDHEFFEPKEQFDIKWINKCFKNPPPNCRRKKKIEISVEDPIFKRHYDKKREIVQNWAKIHLEPDNRTLLEVYQDEKKNKKQIKKIMKMSNRNTKPWFLPNIPDPIKVPFIDRYYCYPSVMVKLGWEVIHYKKIIPCVEHGIHLFLIDLRFGTQKVHSKLVAQVRHARKVISKRVVNEAIFGTAFYITNRSLQTGIVKHKSTVFLDFNSNVILTSDRLFSARCTNEIIYINFRDYLKYFKIGDKIKIGKQIRVVVKNVYERSLECVVIFEGLLESQMPVNLPPETKLHEPTTVTTEEETDIIEAFRLGCDCIVCQPCEGLLRHIHWIQAAKHRSVIIIAVINLSATSCGANIEFALNEFNGVWFSGDGSTENIQLRNYVVRQCFRKFKIIYRSDFLTSPTGLKIPTDEESLKHFFLYPDCIVTDLNSIEISKVRHIIRNYYPNMTKNNMELSLSRFCKRTLTMENIFCEFIIKGALYLKASCIIIANNNGETVNLISQHRPLIPILASFCDMPTARAVSQLRNVYPSVYYNPLTISWENENELRLNYCIKMAMSFGFLRLSDPFIFVYDSQRGLRYSDSYRMFHLNRLQLNKFDMK